MNGHSTRARRAFTLTELLTVLGVVSLLVSLLMPVIAKVRVAADATACVASLRQMGTAWAMYVAEHRGRLPHYMWHGGEVTPEAAWYGYWPGLLDRYEVRNGAILCAAASEPADSTSLWGYGNVARAWSGEHAPQTGATKFTATMFRTSSYGYNRYLTAPAGSAGTSGPSQLSRVKNASNVPAFFDCAFADARPDNYNEAFPAPAPSNLRGEGSSMRSPQHWRFLLARHGRGINVAMADGSARWVRLEETYQLTWHEGWLPYRLHLPLK